MVIFANALATDPILGAIVSALVRSNERTIPAPPVAAPDPPDPPRPPIVPRRARRHRQCTVDESDDDEAIGYPESTTQWTEYPDDFGPSTRVEVLRRKKDKRRSRAEPSGGVAPRDRDVSTASSFPDEETHAINALIANLTIGGDDEIILPDETAPPRPLVAPPFIPPPALQADPRQAIVAEQPKLYSVSSVTMTGGVESWLLAGHLAQTLPHGKARRTNRTVNNHHVEKSAYVVYAGLRPGIYTSWNEANDQVTRVPGAHLKGYEDRLHAERAWLAANVAGTVRILDAAGNAFLVPPTSFPAEVMAAFLDAPDGHFDDGWYVVTKGRTTGIFPTWNLAASQTQGVHGAIYEKFATKAAAEVAYANACNTGITRQL